MSNYDPAQQQQQGNIYTKKPRAYVRQQKGHSLTKHFFLFFLGIGMFTIPYYSFSPNHFWHA